MPKSFSRKHRSGSVSMRSNGGGAKDREGLKSRSIYTKKKGGGGAFTWGKAGDEERLSSFILDEKRDPNYDSDLEDAYYTISFDEDTTHFQYLSPRSEPQLEASIPCMSLENFKSQIEIDIQELFSSNDLTEFVSRISSHNSVSLHFALLKRMVELSMERTDREREICSLALISLQCNQQLPFTQVAKGFERLLENASQLMLDVPNAKRILAQFLARAVADEVLPPAFLLDRYVESLSISVITHSKVLLSMKHGIGRLERVWGSNGGDSVQDLKIELKALLEEYFHSADAGEVSKLLTKMNVPFFHHELVKRGIVLSFEKKEREQAMMSVLIAQLCKDQVLSADQLKLGFQRLFQELEDIALDTPYAPVILNVFVQQALKDNILSVNDVEQIKLNAFKVSREEEKQNP